MHHPTDDPREVRAFCTNCGRSLPDSRVARWNRWFCDEGCARYWQDRKGRR
ncbi:hypothetical protein BKA15_000177 [Microlunatus parietis]|uniref:Uncharacterized protein n=1 Tax=Microlunatus parietis TaxID=682979 RepID=A0A7Y9L9J0_9ACTN|nr:hypothetical protein [Microlunatus parietis]